MTLREFKKAPERRGCLVSILKENQWFYKWKRCGADRSVPRVGFSYMSLRSRDQLVRLHLFQSRNSGNEVTVVSLIVRVSGPSLLRLSGIPFPMHGFRLTVQRLSVLEKRDKGHHCLREDGALDTC